MVTIEIINQKKSLLSKIRYSILRQIKLFVLFFIPKKYKEFCEKEYDLGQPYCITVENIGDEILNNIDLFGSCKNISKTFYDLEDNMEFGSIKIRPNKFSNVSYREMLFQFMIQPFTVGLTILKSSNYSQITSAIKVVTKDANGNSVQKTLFPIIDPYGRKSDILKIKQPYKMNGFTVLSLEKIYPKTRIEIYLYPKLNNLESKKTKFQKFVDWLEK
jgi:hypothetical protein